MANTDQQSRLGYFNAEWWPVSELKRNEDGSADFPAGRKLYAPKYVLRYYDKKIVYHYTTLEGLFGIINENAVWMDHIRYVNDAEEVLHGQKFAKDTLSKLATKNKFGDFCQILRRSSEIISTTEIEEYYVASFSKLDDDLTQWRTYGRDRGVCIGFDLSTLDSHLHFYILDTALAIYRDRQKIGIIIFYVLKYYYEFLKDIEFYDRKLPNFIWKEYPKSLAKKLSFEFVRFKHECFEAEQEIRLIISGEETSKFRSRHHRARGNLIIPYYKTSDRFLRQTDGSEITPPKLPINSITVGPMVRQELSAISIREFIAFHGYDPKLVKVSQLPYRAH